MTPPSEQIPEPSELIYAPSPSWAPVQIAGGLVFLAVTTFMASFWAIPGVLLLLAGLRSWWKLSGDEIDRMRREQELVTAVIPAEPIRASVVRSTND